MILADLLPQHLPDTVANLQVSGFALDNRDIEPGMVFIALQGTQQHGLQFASAAEQAGAVAVLYEPEGAVQDKLSAITVPAVAISGLAGLLGQMADRFYDHPSQHLSITGVTGTDGKTSVTHFIAAAFNALAGNALAGNALAGNTLTGRTAVLGTLGSGQPGALQASTHTTPDALQVHRRLRELVEQGFDRVAMEVSSHALDQQRVNAVRFEVAVLTNLTRDHLDYHGSVAAYAEAKRKLFHRPGLRYAVLNLADEFGQQLAAELQQQPCKVIGYGVGEAADYPKNTVVASQTDFSHQGITTHITSPWGEGRLQAGMLGQFNLENLLAALTVLLVQGIELSVALDAMAQVNTVPGRMQRVQSGDVADKVLVVVDYAHTPGALRSVLQAMRAHTARRLWCVFGCGGDRDTGKRPLMAAAAEQLADKVIVTDDNPRTESPAQIFADIRKGFAQPDVVIFEHDRAQAIQQAICAAQRGDAVLIAGKGHETMQIVAQQKIAFDDREQALMALQECAA